MGLIQIAKQSIQGALSEQWKEAIRCEDLGNDILMVKKTTPTGVISNKSTIIVQPGQCAVIIDNGRVIDATAEDGLYTFDTSSTPSFFAGQFGEVFKEMWQRFTYKGASAKEQAVYFFNTKEIMDNKFGTNAPMLYQDWAHAIKNEIAGDLTPLQIYIRCFGWYTFKITNPALFMSEIAGTTNIYKKEALIEQIRAEVTEAFQLVLSSLGNAENKVPVGELQSKTNFIKELMNKNVYDQPIRRRGISILSFTVGTVTLDDESKEAVRNYETMSNKNLERAKWIEEVYSKAADNDKGVANGVMGIGFMNMSTSGVFSGVQSHVNDNQTNMQEQNNTEFSNTTANVTTNIQKSNGTWECPECKNQADGNFCTNCGTKRPEATKAKFCTHCGTKLDENAKFCPECGEKVQ